MDAALPPASAGSSPCRRTRPSASAATTRRSSTRTRLCGPTSLTAGPSSAWSARRAGASRRHPAPLLVLRPRPTRAPDALHAHGARGQSAAGRWRERTADVSYTDGIATRRSKPPAPARRRAHLLARRFPPVPDGGDRRHDRGGPARRLRPPRHREAHAPAWRRRRRGPGGRHAAPAHGPLRPGAARPRRDEQDHRLLGGPGAERARWDPGPGLREGMRRSVEFALARGDAL